MGLLRQPSAICIVAAALATACGGTGAERPSAQRTATEPREQLLDAAAVEAAFSRAGVTITPVLDAADLTDLCTVFVAADAEVVADNDSAQIALFKNEPAARRYEDPKASPNGPDSEVSRVRNVVVFVPNDTSTRSHDAIKRALHELQTPSDASRDDP